MTNRTILIGDVGGTNARFALANAEQPGFTEARTLECERYDSAVDALRAYIADVGCPEPDVICIAAAGPLLNDTIRITNNHWVLSVSELCAVFGISAVRLMNDFEAAAYSVPFIGQTERIEIGPTVAGALSGDDFAVAVIGPGTGFGAAGLYRRGGELHAVAGEGGHAGFAPENEQQRDILRILHGRQQRVSIEHVVSGRGVENIHIALSQLHGEVGEPRTAAEIFASAARDTASLDYETIQVFFEVLGQVAGDVALTLDTHDGVFIAGGIAKRYPELLASSQFRHGFESKGSHQALMQSIPTTLIVNDEPGLLGAAFVALHVG